MKTKNTYKVLRIGRKRGMSGRRTVIAKGLTQDEARRVVMSYPDSPRSMVIYTKE